MENINFLIYSMVSLHLLLGMQWGRGKLMSWSLNWASLPYIEDLLDFTKTFLLLGMNWRVT